MKNRKWIIDTYVISCIGAIQKNKDYAQTQKNCDLWFLEITKI